MNENYSSQELAKHWRQSLANARRNYVVAKRRRRLATLADLASNLFSIAARNNGMRYEISSKPLSGKANEMYEKAEENYRAAMLDYKGKIAEMNLKNSIRNSGAKKSVNLLQTMVSPVAPLKREVRSLPWKRDILSEIKSWKTPQWLNKK